MTHICVSKLTIIDSDNGLSPGRRQAIIWINAGKLSIGPMGTNFSEFLTEPYKFSFMKMLLKMSSGKRRPFCLGLNVLKRRCRSWQTTISKTLAGKGYWRLYWNSIELSRRYIFNVLTHWGRDEVDAILQTTVSDTISWMKIFEFRLNFHWNLLPRVQFTIFQHWFR